MTPDQFDRFIHTMQETVEASVKATVNGKIDRIDAKLDAHILKVEPILEAYSGLNTIGNLAKWTAGVVTALGVLWALAFKP